MLAALDMVQDFNRRKSSLPRDDNNVQVAAKRPVDDKMSEFDTEKQSEMVSPSMEREVEDIRDVVNARMIVDSPEIRLTPAKDSRDDDETDPFVLGDELAGIQKIITERTTREGEIRR